MRRKIRIALLSLGVVAGYGSAIASSHCPGARRATFEQHVAKICADAARSPGEGPKALGNDAP